MTAGGGICTQRQFRGEAAMTGVREVRTASLLGSRGYGRIPRGGDVTTATGRINGCSGNGEGEGKKKGILGQEISTCKGLEAGPSTAARYPVWRQSGGERWLGQMVTGLPCRMEMRRRLSCVPSGCVLGRHITWPDFHFKKMVLELPEGNGWTGKGAGGAVRRLLHKSRKKTTRPGPGQGGSGA